MVSPLRMHCAYCGMPKSTSQAEVMLHSEKNPYELCWSEDSRQAGS